MQENYYIAKVHNYLHDVPVGASQKASVSGAVAGMSHGQGGEEHLAIWVIG